MKVFIFLNTLILIYFLLFFFSFRSIYSVLQESELIRLAEEVPVDCYNKLCTGLGFSLTQSQTVLTQHHFNFPGALINLFCRWKVKQRDGTNIRALLGETLKNADMGALQTKLLEGNFAIVLVMSFLLHECRHFMHNHRGT